MSLLSDPLLRKFRGYIKSLVKLNKDTHIITSHYTITDDVNPGQTHVPCHCIWQVDLEPLYITPTTNPGMPYEKFVQSGIWILNITFSICGPTNSTHWKGCIHYDPRKLDPIQDNLYRLDSDISIPVEFIISFIFTKLQFQFQS